MISDSYLNQQRQNGKHTNKGNAEFDARLRYENPEWGVSDLEEVIAISAAHNLVLKEIKPMPANNLSVIFEIQHQP